MACKARTRVDLWALWSGLLWQLWQGKIFLVKVLFKEVLNLEVKELLLKLEALEEENEQLRQTNEKLNKEKQRLIYHINQPPRE